MVTVTDLLTTAQVAELLRKPRRAVLRMAAKGDLPVAQKLPGLTGGYLFEMDEILARAAS